MSQRGLAPHPAPRRSSRSPSRHDAGSSHQHAPPSGSNDDRRSASISVAPGEDRGRPRHSPSKALGVHNILNSPEPHFLASGEAFRSLSRPGEGDGAHTASSTRMYGGPRPLPHPMGPSSHPSTPIGSLIPHERHPSPGRNSPASAYQFPGMNDPRSDVSPRLPRSSNLSHRGQFREVDSPDATTFASVVARQATFGETSLRRGQARLKDTPCHGNAFHRTTCIGGAAEGCSSVSVACCRYLLYAG